MEPNLNNDIFDAIGVGHGTSGKVLQAVETFLLADNYIAAHTDEQGKTHDPVWPTLLHTGSGRRFCLVIHEIPSDTPPDEARIGESGQVTPTPGTFVPPEVAAEPPPPQILPTSAFATPQPSHDSIVTPSEDPRTGPDGEPGTAVFEQTQTQTSEEAANRPGEPIDATAPHTPQPPEPDSNVDLDFLARVKKHDERLKPGEPIPAPDA